MSTSLALQFSPKLFYIEFSELFKSCIIKKSKSTILIILKLIAPN